MKERGLSWIAAIVVLTAAVIPVAAHSPGGAIFTTVSDGSEVNFNIYAAKEDVYLDGGPGPGAPQGAAGLDDGTYVFQVTEPSGKTLLSTDPARCRQFTVAGGIITSVAPAGGCAHITGVDVDHNAITVQLMPYNDTPNNGGEYKAWVITVGDFLLGCAALGVNNGLDVVDCGRSAGNQHGFIPRHSKTDNFKVGKRSNLEFDTTFFGPDGKPIDGLQLTWTDTLGASNKKWSYYKPELGVNHFAHIEAVEAGTHQITINDQPGCKVEKFFSPTAEVQGPGTLDIQVKQNDREWTKVIWVYCQ